MDESLKIEDRYRIEVSGWGYDSNFFVEQTDLFWDRSGEKKVLLHHAPSDRGIVFIRLLLQGSTGNTLPVAYEVAAVHPMDCNGRTEVRLRQLRARTKVSQMHPSASYCVEDGQGTCEPMESSAQLEHEEILQ